VVEDSCFSTTTADAINTAKPCDSNRWRDVALITIDNLCRSFRATYMHAMCDRSLRSICPFKYFIGCFIPRPTASPFNSLSKTRFSHPLVVRTGGAPPPEVFYSSEPSRVDIQEEDSLVMSGWRVSRFVYLFAARLRARLRACVPASRIKSLYRVNCYAHSIVSNRKTLPNNQCWARAIESYAYTASVRRTNTVMQAHAGMQFSHARAWRTDWRTEGHAQLVLFNRLTVDSPVQEARTGVQWMWGRRLIGPKTQPITKAEPEKDRAARAQS